MASEKKYYRKLDILRYIACIMILLYHLNIVAGGFLSVCSFFTLSGYLVCLSALSQDKFSIKKYYINLFKKIYIPLLLVVFITVILSKLIPDIGWVNLKQETLSAIFGYNNFWQLNANLDYFTVNAVSPFTHLWFISILLQFELLFPIIFIILKKAKEKINKNIPIVLTALLTVVSIAFFSYMMMTRDIMVVYYNSFARSFSILLGILLALIHYNNNFKISDFNRKFGFEIYIIFMLLFIILNIFGSYESSYLSAFMILSSVLTIIIIQFSRTGSKSKKSDKFMRNLSSITYLIYLTQYPVIFFMQSISLNSALKTALTISIILLVSVISDIALNFNADNKKLKVIFLAVIVLSGSYMVLNEQEYGSEMKELEMQLEDNLKVIEQRNQKYLDSLNDEEEEWNKLLEDLENEEGNIDEIIKKMPVVGIGDSVLLDASNELYKRFPSGYFDGKISRTIKDGTELLNELISSGKLGNIVILSLANNGDYSNKTNENLMNILGNREIYWVNAVGSDDPDFNYKFSEFAKDYPNIHIVQWDKASKGHPEYFWNDKIHPKGEGLKAYADTIYDAIYNDLSEQYQKEKDKLIQQREEDKKEKTAFYGNDALTNLSNNLYEKFENASFNVETDNSFNALYEELKSKADNNTLEYRLVFLFDKEMNITKSDYQKIIDLCQNHKIYIFNIGSEKLSFSNDNVEVIDFYKEIRDNENYTISDKTHLSEEGNMVLANLIYSVLN